MAALARQFGSAALAWLVAAAPAVGAVTLEYQVKASLTFNILHFVSWPAPAGGLTLCIFGDDRFGETLTVIDRESVGGHDIVIRNYAAPTTGDIGNCNAIYFVDSGDYDRSALVSAAGQQPILTFGESPAFAETGGIVQFNLAQGKVTFTVNLVTAERLGLRISSKLLRLAERVIVP